MPTSGPRTGTDSPRLRRASNEQGFPSSNTLSSSPPRAWGGSLELGALAAYLDISIMVMGSEAFCIFGSMVTTAAHRRLCLWHEASHFELVTSDIPEWIWLRGHGAPPDTHYAATHFASMRGGGKRPRRAWQPLDPTTMQAQHPAIRTRREGPGLPENLMHAAATWAQFAMPMRRPNPGQGNCLFHAVSQAWQERGTHYGHLQVRADTIRAMRAHADEAFAGWDFTTPAPPEEEEHCPTRDAYMTAAGKPGAWAGHMELEALGLLYPTRPILVVGPRTPPTIFGNHRHALTPRREDRIALWFQGGHYELITSEIPEWLWQQVWMKGRDTPTRSTDNPVIEVARSSPSDPPDRISDTADDHPRQKEEGPRIQPPT